MTDFRPLGNRVLVKKADPKTQTESGLYVPETSRQVVTEGVVLAVGSDVTELKVGDHVLFGPRGGTEVSLLGRTLHMFREEDIYGVFE